MDEKKVNIKPALAYLSNFHCTLKFVCRQFYLSKW